MNKKTWIVLLFVFSQFIPLFSVSASVLTTDNPKDSPVVDEQMSGIDETQNSKEDDQIDETQNSGDDQINEDQPAVDTEIPDASEDSQEPPKIEEQVPELPTIEDSSFENNKPELITDPENSSDDKGKNNMKDESMDNSDQISNSKESLATLKVMVDKGTQAFIKKIGKKSREIGIQENLYASVMIAQAILESGSGQSQLSQSPYYNLFGVKGAIGGNYVVFKTQEDDGYGHLSSIDAAFRQYDSYENSLKDYADLLKNGISGDANFYKGAWKSNATTYKEATKYLTGRYATDINYGEKLNALITAYDLTDYDKEKIEPKSKDSIVPVANPTISSYFGMRGDEFHRGIDFAVPAGTPINASMSGTVIYSGYHYSWGNYVAIEHGNGLVTLYAHNNSNLVEVGQHVTQGETIAFVGSTGNSTGPHLHFEVCSSVNLAKENLIDPLQILSTSF